jgi:hypothetical protein
MKHPNEAELALYAGRDLSFVAEWRVARHVSRCEECRETAAAFESLRPEMAALSELPANIGWNRLASEMKANIRLGLEAGECVGGTEKESRWALPAFAGMRTVAAYASLVALAGAGVWLQRPLAQTWPVDSGATVLAATGDGIELTKGGHSLGLRYGASRDAKYDVNYADAGGSVGARYVDASTGYVTVVNVNVE